jgi:tetratricopeptide (TPR) repeat protein
VQSIARRLRHELREERVRRDRAAAERRVRELLACEDKAERRRRVTESAEYATWAVVEQLSEASVRAAAADVRLALELAQLACRAAERVEGAEAWLARVRSFPLFHLANAQRVASDLNAADATFARARHLWNSGAGAGPWPLDESRLFDLEASLRRDQGRTSEALELFKRALEVCPTPEAEGRILLNKAATLEQMGDIAGSVEALEQAAPRIDKQKEPRQLWVLRFNQGVALAHLRRFEEVKSRMGELTDFAVELGNRLDLVRVLWLRARAEDGLGREDEAEADLKQVIREFALYSIFYDAALATLELARLYLRQGRAGDTRDLAQQAEPTFRKLRLERKAKEAVDLFCEAAKREIATLELVERAIEALRRARPRMRNDEAGFAMSS